MKGHIKGLKYFFLEMLILSKVLNKSEEETGEIKGRMEDDV